MTWCGYTFARSDSPLNRKTKLIPRGGGPFLVVEQLNDDTYKVVLPLEYQVHKNSNVCHLSTFPTVDDDDISN